MRRSTGLETFAADKRSAVLASAFRVGGLRGFPGGAYNQGFHSRP